MASGSHPLRIEAQDAAAPVVVEVATLQRETLTAETVGLTLHEAKESLPQLQTTLVRHQAAVSVDQQRWCPHCGGASRGWPDRSWATRTMKPVIY